jgi:ketosteroid isomerase-like protein
VIAHFARCVAARELDQLVALYELEAVFVDAAGSAAVGAAAIREALAGLLSLEPEFKVAPVSVQRAGGIALVCNAWELQGRTADGGLVDLRGTSNVVLREQSDASWRMLIDRP